MVLAIKINNKQQMKYIIFKLLTQLRCGVDTIRHSDYFNEEFNRYIREYDN